MLANSMNWSSNTSFVPTVEKRVSPVDTRNTENENVGSLLHTKSRSLANVVLLESVSAVG